MEFFKNACALSPFHCLGQQSMVNFPERAEDIQAVMKSKSFCVEDLEWIAVAIDACIRCTVEEPTFLKLVASGSDVKRDCLYGVGPVSVHLLFKWQETTGGSGRLVGHFDVLRPTEMMIFSLFLLPDVPWNSNNMFGPISVCLRLLVYITLINIRLLCRGMLQVRSFTLPWARRGWLSRKEQGIQILYNYIIYICICFNWFFFAYIHNLGIYTFFL